MMTWLVRLLVRRAQFGIREGRHGQLETPALRLVSGKGRLEGGFRNSAKLRLNYS